MRVIVDVLIEGDTLCGQCDMAAHRTAAEIVNHLAKRVPPSQRRAAEIYGSRSDPTARLLYPFITPHTFLHSTIHPRMSAGSLQLSPPDPLAHGGTGEL